MFTFSLLLFFFFFFLLLVFLFFYKVTFILKFTVIIKTDY